MPPVLQTRIPAGAPPAEPPLRTEAVSIRQRVLRGSIATLIGYASGNLIRLGSNLVLTRLLFPEYFGVMALVNVFIQGLHMFSDIGIGPSIIQHPRGDEPRFLHTAWTIQVLRGVALSIVAAAMAWPMSAIYGRHELVWMIPVAATTALIDGFTSTHVFSENRHLRLWRVIGVEVAAQLGSAVAMIVTALATRSIVALLVGGIASASLRMVLSHLALPGTDDGFAWDAEARHALVKFGRWIFVSTAFTFLGLQLDRIMLGRLVPWAVLGVYSIAAMLAALPREVYGQLSQRVLYPMIAGYVRDGHGEHAIRTFRQRVLLLAIVPMGVVIGASESVIELLYDDRYLQAGRLMGLLCLGTWFNVLGSTYGVVVLAHGQPKWISFGMGAKSLVFAAFAVPVHHWAGIEGVALLVSVAEGAVVVATMLGGRAFGVMTLGMDVLATLSVLVVAFVTRNGAAELTGVLGTPVPGLLFLAVGAAAIFLVLLWTMRLVGTHVPAGSPP